MKKKIVIEVTKNLHFNLFAHTAKRTEEDKLHCFDTLNV